jgi:hypothetical protein
MRTIALWSLRVLSFGYTSNIFAAMHGYAMGDNSIALPSHKVATPAIYVFITLFIGWSRNVSFINLDLP